MFRPIPRRSFNDSDVRAGRLSSHAIQPHYLYLSISMFFFPIPSASFIGPIGTRYDVKLIFATLIAQNPGP